MKYFSIIIVFFTFILTAIVFAFSYQVLTARVQLEEFKDFIGEDYKWKKADKIYKNQIDEVLKELRNGKADKLKSLKK